ncbi:MAG TPA: DNRLRE domain-containing protein [Terriglobales bacterium]|nr:DNRLRE domain-containing protein [Terriglobales bacterium]
MPNRTHSASSFCRWIGLVFSVLLLVAAASAQITPSGDAYTNTAAPNNNYGNNALLGIRSPSLATYIQFDFSSIPAGYTGSNVAKATLKLYVNAVSTSGSFNVVYVNGTWAENSITANLSPALDGTIVASIPLTKSQVGDYILIDVTPALQSWLNNTHINDGIALIANSPLNASFDSKENTNESHPPELDVVFTSGGTITGVMTSAGSGLQGGGTSGTLNLSLTTACAANQVLMWNGSAWACSNAGGGGTVTSVGLTAPSSDFLVTNSPVTTNGTIGLGWQVAPDWNNTPGAMVKRDSTGSFSAGTINATNGFNLDGNLFALGSYSNSNAFFGFAGNNTMTGSSNTAAGARALQSNAGGGSNTAVGNYALNANIGYGNFNGSRNTAIGSGALALNNSATPSANESFNNTALGAAALGGNTTGYSNTVSGVAAMINNATGNENTASGLYALRYNTSGSYNSAFGSYSGTDQSSTALQFATAIGAYADVGESNALVLGSIQGVNNCKASNGCANTNVGIGTITPQFTLDVNGTGNFTGAVNFASPVTFAPGQTFPGAGGSGTVTSVGLTAPSTDFIVTDSPVTGNGNLGLGWITAPDFNNTPNAIVKRDSTGSFSAGLINATLVNSSGFNLGGNPFAFGDYAKINAFLGFAGNPELTTIGTANTAAGVRALQSNTQGFDNTAIGAGALGSNVGSARSFSGSANTAVGQAALFSNNSTNPNAREAYLNTAIGNAALSANTIGNQNTASGGDALTQNTTGNLNTGTGMWALRYNTTGSYDSAFGSYSGTDPNATSLQFATAIGAYADVGESNALVLGSIQGVNGCDASFGCANTMVGIGTTTPQFTLDVNGTGNFTGPVAFGSPVTFASGQTFPGAGSGTVTSVGLAAPSTDFIVTGSPVTGNGTLGLGWITAPDFNNTANAIVKRDSTGSFSAGTISAASGFNIGTNPFAFGSYDNNSAFLGFSGNAVTTGSGNMAAGFSALGANTTGFYNTASGAYALYRNTVGHDNTAIGLNALLGNTSGIYNTASGSGALSTNSTGRENTANGFGALIQNTTGNFNTASGFDALITNTTGSSNTGLGFAADVGSGDLTNATAIGAGSEVTQSNSLVLGSIAGVNSATSNTNVGIGTTAPSNIFTIGQGFGHAIADGWDTYSSRRWKTNIHKLHDALGKIEQLRGVSYDLKDSGKHEIGVIAEEVGAVIPEVVSWEKNGKDAQGVDYGRLTALLIEATKEQQALIQKQQQQIRAQQTQIKQLTRQVREVKATLKAISEAKPGLRSAKDEHSAPIQR